MGSKGGFGAPISGPRKALALHFGVPGKPRASKLVIFRFWDVFRVRFGGPGRSFWSTILSKLLENRYLKTLHFREAFSEAFFNDAV